MDVFSNKVPDFIQEDKIVNLHQSRLVFFMNVC